MNKADLVSAIAAGANLTKADAKNALDAALGAIAGALAMFLGVVTYAFSAPGITSIATYMDEGNNFLLLLVVMAVAWLASFAISFALCKKEQ